MAVVPKHYNSKGSAPVNKTDSYTPSVVHTSTSAAMWQHTHIYFIYWGGPLADVVFWHNGHFAMGQPLRLTKGAGARTRGPCACLLRQLHACMLVIKCFHMLVLAHPAPAPGRD